MPKKIINFFLLNHKDINFFKIIHLIEILWSINFVVDIVVVAVGVNAIETAVDEFDDAVDVNAIDTVVDIKGNSDLTF